MKYCYLCHVYKSYGFDTCPKHRKKEFVITWENGEAMKNNKKR